MGWADVLEIASLEKYDFLIFGLAECVGDSLPLCATVMHNPPEPPTAQPRIARYHDIKHVLFCSNYQ